MARRPKKDRSWDRPFAKAPATAAPEPAPTWHPGADHTCTLPPPANWPDALKRFVVAMVLEHEASTWEAWCWPFHKNTNPQEPMWMALRTAGAYVRGGATWKIITNEEAWELCIRTLAMRSERHMPSSEAA
jgi:hypothetical protein